MLPVFDDVDDGETTRCIRSNANLSNSDEAARLRREATDGELGNSARSEDMAIAENELPMIVPAGLELRFPPPGPIPMLHLPAESPYLEPASPTLTANDVSTATGPVPNQLSAAESGVFSYEHPSPLPLSRRPADTADCPIVSNDEPDKSVETKILETEGRGPAKQESEHETPETDDPIEVEQADNLRGQAVEIALGEKYESDPSLEKRRFESEILPGAIQVYGPPPPSPMRLPDDGDVELVQTSIANPLSATIADQVSTPIAQPVPRHEPLPREAQEEEIILLGAFPFQNLISHTTEKAWFYGIALTCIVLITASLAIMTLVIVVFQPPVHSTRSPTMSPTYVPSTSPHLVRTGSPIGSEANTPHPSTNRSRCFDDLQELSRAVDDYLQDGPDSDAALDYGPTIGSWCVSRVTSFASLFSVERNPLVRSFNEDISQWTTSGATSMENMFLGTAAFNQDLSLWDTSWVSTFQGMFKNARRFNQNLSGWDTSRARTLESMFEGASTFNGRVEAWDTSNVNNMIRVFRRATVFNQDISSWDVSRVTSLRGFFDDAPAFNQNLSSWDVRNTVDMNAMFRRATSFNGDVRSWNIASLHNAHFMFAGATSFNQDLSSWTLAIDIMISSMFYGATSFNGNITTWEVSTVDDFHDFLRNATSFNQDLSSWDVGSGIHLHQMFFGASQFRQNLCTWSIPLYAITRVHGMFTDTTCPVTGDPDLTARPITPLCFPCS